MVSLSNMTEFGAVEYRCDLGYRMAAGVSKAVCWKTGSDPLKKLMNWVVVPRCLETCPATVGRRGNVLAVALEISNCIVNAVLEKSYPLF